MATRWQTAQEEGEGFDVTKWSYSSLLLDCRVALVSATEESGGSLSGWYQCFPVLDTENSIHIDNTGHIPRAFKHGLEPPIQCHFTVLKFYDLWGTKFSEESHEKKNSDNQYRRNVISRVNVERSTNEILASIYFKVPPKHLTTKCCARQTN